MSEKQFERNVLLFGEEVQQRLAHSSVIVFGAGGVGGYCIECLARVGIGRIAIVDNKPVDVTNLNRQLIAAHSTIGQLKVEVFARRIADVNPSCKVEAFPVFYDEGNTSISLSQYDLVVDCIDSIDSKLYLICKAKEEKVDIISAMGAARKTDASQLRIADIYSTGGCALSKTLRPKLRERGIDSLTVVYSPQKTLVGTHAVGNEKVLGSMVTVPATMGILLADEAIRRLVAK